MMSWIAVIQKNNNPDEDVSCTVSVKVKNAAKVIKLPFHVSIIY